MVWVPGRRVQLVHPGISWLRRIRLLLVSWWRPVGPLPQRPRHWRIYTRRVNKALRLSHSRIGKASKVVFYSAWFLKLKSKTASREAARVFLWFMYIILTFFWNCNATTKAAFENRESHKVDVDRINRRVIFRFLAAKRQFNPQNALRKSQKIPPCARLSKKKRDLEGNW